jgi:predicted SnoaL-like aldol condensation-catalyzing enzyme
LQSAIYFQFSLHNESDCCSIACETKVIINKETVAMRKAIIVLSIVGVFAINYTAKAQNTSESSQSETSVMSKKATVGTFLGAVMKNDPATMREVANTDYIQHNPYIPTGLEPFIKMLPILQENGTHAENIRMFQDGNYVFMHNIWHNAKPFGAEEMVSFDIIRLDGNGKVAEHWDALVPLVKETASGRTQTDGPTTAKDLDKTEANKATAKAMVEDILMGKNPEKITDYISAERYDQHNPDIKDGLSGIIEAVQYLTSQNNMFKYTKIHKVLGEGNFVLTVSEGKWGGKNYAFYDLLRFENGKAVEHWDVIQEIPTEGLANENGMFGFN